MPPVENVFESNEKTYMKRFRALLRAHRRGPEVVKFMLEEYENNPMEPGYTLARDWYLALVENPYFVIFRIDGEIGAERNSAYMNLFQKIYEINPFWRSGPECTLDLTSNHRVNKSKLLSLIASGEHYNLQVCVNQKAAVIIKMFATYFLSADYRFLSESN